MVADYRAHAAARGSRVRRADEPGFGGGTELHEEGGPVMHSVTTHVIYWDPSGRFTTTTKEIVEGFLGDVAHESGKPTNTFAIAGQYTDAAGNAAYDSRFAGALVDTHAYPNAGNCEVPKGEHPGEIEEGPYSTCLFDGQLQSELESFVAKENLPRGPEQLYLLLTPHEVATCLEEEFQGEQVCSNNFYCAYHSWIEPGSNEIIYADIPFSLLDSNFAKGCQADGLEEIQLPNGDRGSSDTETRFADVALKYLAHEYIESATDPLVGKETAWVDEEGLEIADKCNSVPFHFEFEGKKFVIGEGEPGFDKKAFSPTLGGNAAAGTLFDQSIDGGGSTCRASGTTKPKRA